MTRTTCPAHWTACPEGNPAPCFSSWLATSADTSFFVTDWDAMIRDSMEKAVVAATSARRKIAYLRLPP